MMKKLITLLAVFTLTAGPGAGIGYIIHYYLHTPVSDALSHFVMAVIVFTPGAYWYLCLKKKEKNDERE